MSEQATSIEEKVCMQWKQAELIGGAPVYYLDEYHAVAIKNYIDRIDIVFFERVKEIDKYYCRITKKHSLDAKKIKEDYESLNEEVIETRESIVSECIKNSIGAVKSYALELDEKLMDCIIERIEQNNAHVSKTPEQISQLEAENKKLQKDVDDFAKAYAKQIQLIVDVTDKVRTIIGIEPIEFVKKELVELKEVLLKHMEESAK